MHKLDTLIITAGQIQSAIPVPNPTAPPGSEGLITILGWISWIIFGLAVAAILVVSGKMMFDNGRGGGGGQAATGLIWVLGGCIIAAVASGLVGTIVGVSGGLS
ncbi:hypothetical protein [Pseudarthrobacter sp. PS3-L1]|uniref:hypothetical protein n=1 Tax=Pseudarthrobacter sp. PS3-L1 TaxID=3046207 RepID=UPI0024B88AEA|nr:hypothetical protein [Pseudarthrobacter sp. PS3-L1]MDJ0322119.1 hypothetical protein [Pseudarthrobacter sp. PS3-L1]